MSGVVALDTFDPEGTIYMRQVFPDIIEPGHPSYATWTDHAVGLLVAKSKVTADTVHRAKKLKFIVRHGTGYDNIDAEACREKGVVLCKNDLSFFSGDERGRSGAFAGLCVCEEPRATIASATSGRPTKQKAPCSPWRKTSYGKDVRYCWRRKNWSTDGKEVVRLFSIPLAEHSAEEIPLSPTDRSLYNSIGAFDGNIILYDPYIPTDGYGPWGVTIPCVRASSLEDMLPLVDVLSLHVPLLPETEGLVSMAHLTKMKQTAILINVARGGVVNEADLWEALREGIIASAGVDAWVSEPPTRKVYGDIFDLDNLIMSPHIGGSPAEIQTATCVSMVDHMKEMIDGKPPRDRVA